MSEIEPTPTSKTAISSPRITIAFPFSAIKTEEASSELQELARIVSALADEIAQMQPSTTTKALAEQAHAVLATIGG